MWKTTLSLQISRLSACEFISHYSRGWQWGCSEHEASMNLRPKNSSPKAGGDQVRTPGKKVSWARRSVLGQRGRRGEGKAWGREGGGEGKATCNYGAFWNRLHGRAVVRHPEATPAVTLAMVESLNSKLLLDQHSRVQTMLRVSESFSTFSHPHLGPSFWPFWNSNISFF